MVATPQPVYWIDLPAFMADMSVLRRDLQPHFSADTADDPARFTRSIGKPATGHGAAVALLAAARWPGLRIVRASVMNGALADAGRVAVDHYFNRGTVLVGDKTYDADITGDQFSGRVSVSTAAEGQLWTGSSEVLPELMGRDVVERAVLLARRSGMSTISEMLMRVATPEHSPA